MAQNKTMEYRQDGFRFCLEFLKQQSIDELEQEIRDREETGITINIPFIVLNSTPGMIQLRDFIYQAQDVIFLAALKKMCFGKKRLERNYYRVIENKSMTIQGAYKKVIENNLKIEKIVRAKNPFERFCDKKTLKTSVGDYIKIRDDGIKRGYEILKEKGSYALRKQITKSKFNRNMSNKEIVMCDNIARSYFNEAGITEWLIALHENEGFANKRLNEVMDEFELLHSNIKRGKMGLKNYIDHIKKTADIDVPCNAIKDDFIYKKVGTGVFWEEKKKPKKKKQEIIEEPQVYHCYPCAGCKSRELCNLRNYKKDCTAFALYKEVRKENVRKKKNE